LGKRKGSHTYGLQGENGRGGEDSKKGEHAKKPRSLRKTDGGGGRKV